MREVQSRAIRPVLLFALCLSACSTPTVTPLPKSIPEPVPLKMTQAEFLERFAKLPLPAPVSRIEYLFGQPHDKLVTKDQKLPAMYLYHCRDGQMWISFGSGEGRYGALTSHEGAPSDEDRNTALALADQGAKEALENAQRQGLEQKERRVAYVTDRLIENRDRILALREEQAAFAEAQWVAFQENIGRFVDVERQRLVKACPPLTSADKITEEVKHRNIRLQTLFRDEIQTLNSSLGEKQHEIDDKVRVMHQSLERGVRELNQLVAETKELRKQLGEDPLNATTSEKAPLPDEAPALERWQAVLKKLPDLQPPVLTAEDASTVRP